MQSAVWVDYPERNMQAEIELARKWLRYFARPSKHYASRTNEELAERVSRWAGERVRTQAFEEAASQLGYEMRGDKIKAAIA